MNATTPGKEPTTIEDMDWRLPPFWGRGILLAWWLGLGAYYYSQPEMSFRWELAFEILPNPLNLTAQAIGCLAKALLALGGFGFMGISVGGWCLAKLGLQIEDRIESLGFRLGLGWGIVGCLMAVLGLLKLWYVGPVMVLLAALTLWTALAGPKANYAGTPLGGGTPWNAFDYALAALLVLFAAFNLLCTLIPEIFYDALTYHLALPDLYWRRHGFFPTPDNVFSGLPLLIQMLYGLALPIGGEELTHALHWSLGVAAAFMAYASGRRLGGRRAGLLAALFFYSNPLVGVMSWKSGVDLGTAFFQLLAVQALVLASTERAARREWLIVSGALCGFAMGTKYQAWPLAGVMV
ncbi:MAG: glycosyltransferase family 39 protein, partial [Elusimicrobiota bacterium]|nr:glycosyltransferase family 39 protein [Elusimicrobiota bacterium]